jgi:hypothetical protein
VSVVPGGFPSFAAKYPFVDCGFTAEERAAGGTAHKHMPAYPWFPNEIIDDAVFLGNHSDAVNVKHLKLLGVTHVLNVSTEIENFHERAFEYLNLQLDDAPDADISAHFDKVRTDAGRADGQAGLARL